MATIACRDYGFDCSFKLNEELSISLISQVRDHFEEEHGIDYSADAIIQMIVNRGHSLESIKKA